MRLGDYELEDVLGRGAMGTVHRARHGPTGAVRAVKILTGTDPVRLARFRREAEALARVRGEGVVPVHEVGVAQGVTYFAMGLMAGGSLRERPERRGRFEWREACAITIALARAIGRCHAAGLVHRDLKPENILFDDRDDARIADFGLARDLASEGLTKTGAILGTAAYMAPEQINGGAVDGRADVYALGVVLHELIAGATPHAGATPYEILTAKLEERSAPLPATAPPGLAAVIGGALAANPDERFATAEELAVALEDVVAQRPDSRTGRPGARARQTRTLAVASAVALVLAVLVAVVVARSSRDGATASADPKAAPVVDARRAPVGDLVRARQRLLEAARAIRRVQPAQRVRSLVGEARAAAAGAPLPLDALAEVGSAAYDRIRTLSVETTGLEGPAHMESVFGEIQALVAITSSVGALAHPPREVGVIALGQASLLCAKSAGDPAAFEVALFAVESDPAVADSVAELCATNARHMKKGQPRVRFVVDRAIELAPPELRSKVLVRAVDFELNAREPDRMLRRALAAVREDHAKDTIEAVATVLTFASWDMKVSPVLYDELVAEGGGCDELRIARAWSIVARADEALGCLLRGNVPSEALRYRAAQIVTRDRSRLKGDLRILIQAGKVVDAANVVKLSDSPELAPFEQRLRAARTPEERAALVRELGE